MASEIIDTGTLVGFAVEGPYLPYRFTRDHDPVEPYCVLCAKVAEGGQEHLKILAYLDRDEVTDLSGMLEDMWTRLDAAYEKQFEGHESLAEHDRKESERTW